MKPATTSLLLVDDDHHLNQSMAEWLREQSSATGSVYQVDTAESLHEAKQRLQHRSYDLLITDLRLGQDDGFSLIGHAKRHCPGTAILVMTGYATPETAISAVRAGAFDLLTKPIIDDELTLAIERALSQREVARENETLRQQLDQRAGMESILSHDYRMLKIFETIESIADARASILITGENGTGKSMIARAIHARSSRRGQAFVEVACGALPDTLLESELFGHVAGAYTGANHDRAGKFQLADGGTIFLDEIATATPAMQVKLLRVLQEFQFEPLGGTSTHSVDTRVILATNENLSKAVAEGSFRQDLYYRVNVVNIMLPALRERIGDLPLLVDHFLHEAAEASGRSAAAFDRESMQVMMQYSWPGNIRQLENVVERAVLLSRNPTLSIEDLPPELLGGGPTSSGSGAERSAQGAIAAIQIPAGGMSLSDALEAPERQIILQTLRQHHWNRAATADTLQINRTTLYKKMKRLGLDDPRLQYA